MDNTRKLLRDWQKLYSADDPEADKKELELRRALASACGSERDRSDILRILEETKQMKHEIMEHGLIGKRVGQLEERVQKLEDELNSLKTHLQRKDDIDQEES